MEDLKTEGLIRHYGASVETIEEAFTCLQHEQLAGLQIIFNLFRQDAKNRLLDAAREKDVGIIVRLPLASGLLEGRFTADSTFAPGDQPNRVLRPGSRIFQSGLGVRDGCGHCRRRPDAALTAKAAPDGRKIRLHHDGPVMAECQRVPFLLSSRIENPCLGSSIDPGHSCSSAYRGDF